MLPGFEFLAAGRTRLDETRATLTAEVEQISRQLERDRAETARGRDEIQQHSEELNRQTETLKQLTEELETRQAGWDEAQQRAVRQYETFSEQIQGQQNELANSREALDQRRAEVESAQRAVEIASPNVLILQRQACVTLLLGLL